MILLLYLKINKYKKKKKSNIIKREKEIQKAIKTLQIYYCGHNGLFECSEHIDNDIQDAFIKLSDRFSIIKIPAINSIELGDWR